MSTDDRSVCACAASRASPCGEDGKAERSMRLAAREQHMLAGARFFERLAMGHVGVNDQSPE